MIKEGFSTVSEKFSFITNIFQAGKIVWEVHPGYTLIIITTSLIQGILPACQMWLSKLLIDALVVTTTGFPAAYTNLKTIVFLVGAQAALFLIGVLLSTCQEIARSLLGELLGNHIILKILQKTNGVDVSYFEDERFYNKLQNAVKEANYRPLDIVYQSFILLQTTITLTSMTFLLMRLHWLILPVIVTTTLPYLFVQKHYGSLQYWMLRERAPEIRKQNYYSMLLTTNWFIKEIRAFRLEEFFLKLYRNLFNKFFQENRRLFIKRNASNIIASGISIGGWFFAMGYVVLRTVEGTITIGDFSMYMQAITSTQGQIRAILAGVTAIYANSLFLQNLFEFLSLPTYDSHISKHWSESVEEIEFKNVSFYYPGTDRMVLENLNFSIHRGQSLAIVGKNGSGKSTLVKLLCRLYEPTSGNILINGRNIIDYSSRSIQEYMSILFQDYGNYYITAHENIGIGRFEKISDIKEIKSAANLSGAKGIIEALPQQYNTMLGKWFKDGTELSGGEWKKIALARDFFRGGDVLVLDEPTASLDAESEQYFAKYLSTNCTHQIVFITSHRLSTARMADRIMLLDCGKCIEMGSHQELMRKGGLYYRLFIMQGRGYGTDYLLV